ncbi:hypothetical protein CsSME_00048183 [Camellia sinensis var. sinensis]
MKSSWKRWWSSVDKHTHLFVKLALSILLFGLAFRFIFSQATGFSNVADTPFIKQSVNPKPAVSIDFPENQDHFPGNDTPKCDIFSGDWIPTSGGPLYTNESCSLIEDHQNCMKNGRPDTGYLNWRWNPRNCELPAFNAELFLSLMRNKTWVLIGDSITRNHVEQAIQVYHDEEYRSKGWHFPSYNFTISVFWSPFLAKAAIFENYNGVSTSPIDGKWFVKTAFYYENGTILGCHNCPKENQTELGFDLAYRKVLQKVFNFIVSSNHTGMIIYRTSTPDHFENGEWYNGGNCLRTEPGKEGD